MWHTVRIPAVLVLVLATAGLTVRHGSHQRDALPSWVIRHVERSIQASMAVQRVPGLAVAIERDGKRWSEGFGLADVENHVPVTCRSIFRLASISKPITAVAVLQLAAAGKLDLDAPIQTYVPCFPEKRWPVTCRLLLTHQAGVRWYRGMEMASTRHYQTVREGLGQFQNDPLEFRPGTRFLYSTYGYNLLGAAVEGASGQSYMDYVQQHIFQPSGMAHTRDDSAEAIIADRAAGYRRSKNGELLHSVLADTSNKIPGGGLCGTARDVVAFAEALWHGKLLTPEWMARMVTPQRLANRSPTGYGLGWHIGRHHGVREVSHEGRQPGVSGLLYIRPETHVTIALLCDIEGVHLLELAREIADEVETAR